MNRLLLLFQASAVTGVLLLAGSLSAESPHPDQEPLDAAAPAESGMTRILDDED